MTLINDLSGNNSSNDENNDNNLEVNDISNNNLSNNDLSNKLIDDFMKNEIEPIFSKKEDSNSDHIKNTINEEKKDIELEDKSFYYNYLDDISNNNIETKRRNINNVIEKDLNKINDILKILNDMIAIDKKVRHLDNFNDINNSIDKKVQLYIKDKNDILNNKSMENKKLKDLIKKVDDKFKFDKNLENLKSLNDVDEMLFLNKEKKYINAGTSMDPSFLYKPIPISKKLPPISNKENIIKENEEKNKIDEIIKEKKNVEASIETIQDLIDMIDNYPIESNIEYNINMKAMHNIKPDLVNLNNMIGMHSLKMNIVDQILYFIQDLHINPKKEEEIEEDLLHEENNKKSLFTTESNVGFKNTVGGIFGPISLSPPSLLRQSNVSFKNNNNNDYLHTVIYGPPGTGKTEVAKIMGKIYSKLGILKKGIFKKATRSDFIAGYLGQTAIKTRDLIEDCLGGVLFIDEAYALGNNENKDTFAKEAIDTLCESLSNHKDNIMVIIAGYEKELNTCFFSFNQGLESRFPWRFKTDDYKADELKLIFKKKVHENEWLIDDSVLQDEWFESKMDTFNNYGRDMETLFSKVKISHGRRIFCKFDIEKKRITIEDLDKGYVSYLENENNEKRKNERIFKEIRHSLYL